MHEAFYEKYFAHAQAVRTRPLLGGEGPGDEANEGLAQTHSNWVYFSLGREVGEYIFVSGLAQC